MIMDFLKKHAGTILTVISALGLCTTVALTIKASPEAEQAKATAQEKKGEEPLNTVEVVKAVAPVYGKAAAVGAGTLACIFSANALNRKQQACMAGAYVALERLYDTYKDQVDALGGAIFEHSVEKTTEDRIKDADDGMPPWDEIQTFYICGRFVERTMEQVVIAEYDLNRNFVLGGRVTLGDFLRLLDLEDFPEEYEKVGWDEYLGETIYGYRWIDFNNQHRRTDDGMLVCDICTPFEPHVFEEGDGEDTVSVCGVE